MCKQIINKTTISFARSVLPLFTIITYQITINDSIVWDSHFRVCEKMEPLLSSRGLLANYHNELAMRYDSIAVRALLTSDNRAVISLALKRAKSLSSNYLHLAPFYDFYLRTILGFRLAEMLRCFISRNRVWKFLRYGIR